VLVTHIGHRINVGQPGVSTIFMHRRLIHGREYAQDLAGGRSPRIGELDAATAMGLLGELGHAAPEQDNEAWAEGSFNAGRGAMAGVQAIDPQGRSGVLSARN
jgi:hypothetical protein